MQGTRLGSGGLPLQRKNTFRIDTVWKGEIGSEFSVYDSGNEASCGVAFKRGERYLVYAFRSDSGKWYTYLCSRTTAFDAAADDLQQLGEGTLPRGAGRAMAGWAGALAIAAAAAWIIRRRWKR